MAKQIRNTDLFSADVFKKTQEDAKLLVEELNKLETSLVEVAKAQKQILSNQDNQSKKSIEETNTSINKLNEAERITLKVRKEKENLEARLKQGRKKQTQDNEVIRQQIQAEAKTRRTAAKEALKLTNAYDRESRKLAELRKKYKGLAISEKEVSKEQKELLVQITLLDSKLKRVDKTVGQSQRNVGNYASGLNRVGASLKSILFAGGVVGVFLGIGRAIKNAFNRVREFDKEMQNLAGIAGIARKDLKSTEETIKNVAGSSIKTSNEVAKLATTLFALGKTQREVEQLLKPTNDLSIALGATSDEAGELLVSTLNAFGKGADEGEKFADVIAKMRTSTSLDFERIKDSLGFVSATASVLNLTIGETGALVGVLQDNGVKAARAGRLLNSSFIKLAKEGKTLEGSLDRINEAQERGATSMELLQIAEADFGTQSASLGVILANNRDRVAELSNEFDNLSEGSLKELTDEQLKSMDAQLKILDSTWEKFLLNIENGEGILSDIFRNSITSATRLIERIDNLSVSLKNINKIGGRENLLKSYTDAVTGLDIFQTKQEAVTEAVDKKTDELAEKIVAKNKEAQKTILKDIEKRIKDDIKLLDEVGVAEQFNVEKRINANILLLKKLRLLNQEEEKSVKVIEEKNEEIGKTVKATRELTGLIEKQEKVVSDLNTQLKQATSEEEIFSISFDIKFQKEELERLKRIASSTREEFELQQVNLIEDGTERQIAHMQVRHNKLLKLIRTNSKTTAKEKEELEKKAEKDFDDKATNLQIKKGVEAIKRDEKIFQEQFKQKRTGFKTEEAFEKEKEAQFKAARKIALQDELELLEQFGDEKTKLRQEEIKAELQGLNEFEKGLNKTSELVEAALEVIADLIDEAFEKRIEALGESIDKTGERVNQLRENAKEGQLDADQSIAAEQKREAELEKQRERERKRQQQTQAFFSVLSAFQANVSSGSATPLLDTIRDVGVLKALASGLSAYDGVDDTGGRGDIDSKGGKIWTLHPNEQVWSKKDRSEVGFRNRKEIKDIVGMYDNGMMKDLMNYDQSNEVINPYAFKINGIGNKAIETKLDQLNRSVQNIKIPETTVKADEMRNILTITKRTGNKIEKQHSKLH